MKIFPIHDVKAIGLKLLTREGSSLAAALPISFMAPTFQAEGTVDVDQQQL